MQTFMPEGSDFGKTARNLDYKRLNKQGVEAYQIFRINAGLTNGFKNHPACLMWKGHESTLLEYSKEIYKEVERRHYSNATLDKIYNIYNEYYSATAEPDWLDDIRVVITHRGNLFRKMPDFYPEYSGFTDYRRYACCNVCNYYWPTHITKDTYTNENLSR
jgi:hypothetical protein